MSTVGNDDSNRLILRLLETGPTGKLPCVGRIAGWSSLVARQAHNLKVAGSNPAPATNLQPAGLHLRAFSETNSGEARWYRLQAR